MAPLPSPPDPVDATVEDWEEFKQLYAGWLETASEEDIVAEMAAIGEIVGRPLSPSESWRFFYCEQRRKRPKSTKTSRAKKET